MNKNKNENIYGDRASERDLNHTQKRVKEKATVSQVHTATGTYTHKHID